MSADTSSSPDDAIPDPSPNGAFQNWRKTPTEGVDELTAACIANDSPRFTVALDKWTSYGYAIHELRPVMRQAVELNNPDLNFAFEALRFKAKEVLGLFAINEPMGETMTTLLGYAAVDEDMVLWLLDHEADPNKQTKIDHTPLSVAIVDASLSTIKLLFERGADVHKGEPLHHAVVRKPDVAEVLALLHEKGASLNAKMYENHPSSYSFYFFLGLGLDIHQAASRGQVDAVRYLLERGADPTIKEATQRTALDWATEFKHEEVVRLLKPAIEKAGA
ncbi:putative hspc200 [Aspergillus varians]